MIPMTTTRKIEIALFLLALLLLAIVLRSWILSREALIRAQEAQKTTDTIVAERSANIKTRDLAAAGAYSYLTQQAAAVTTPQQAAQVIVRYLPQPTARPGSPAAEPAPIATVQRNELSEQLQAKLPDAPSYGVLTQDQLLAQAKLDLACQSTGVNLNACLGDKQDLQAELTAEKQSAATWKAAARGGTTLQRVLRIAKYTACAGGGAYLGLKFGRSAPAGAAIGGGAAVVGCSFF